MDQLLKTQEKQQRGKISQMTGGGGGGGEKRKHRSALRALKNSGKGAKRENLENDRRKEKT